MLHFTLVLEVRTRDFHQTGNGIEPTHRGSNTEPHPKVKQIQQKETPTTISSRRVGEKETRTEVIESRAGYRFFKGPCLFHLAYTGGW